MQSNISDNSGSSYHHGDRNQKCSRQTTKWPWEDIHMSRISQHDVTDKLSKDCTHPAPCNAQTVGSLRPWAVYANQQLQWAVIHLCILPSSQLSNCNRCVETMIFHNYTDSSCIFFSLFSTKYSLQNFALAHNYCLNVIFSLWMLNYSVVCKLQTT